MADSTHVHASEVVATTGMRSHIGENAKLSIVTGTQIFHSATRSSLRLARYLAMASASDWEERPCSMSSRVA